MNKLFTLRMNDRHLGVIWADRLETREDKSVFYDDKDVIIAILNGITTNEDTKKHDL